MIDLEKRKEELEARKLSLGGLLQQRQLLIQRTEGQIQKEVAEYNKCASQLELINEMLKKEETKSG